jgi:hypothetical protein
MANSNIIITFNEEFSTIRYSLEFNDSLGGTPRLSTFVWRSVRSNPFQVVIGSSTITTGERTAINFMDALNLDLPSQYSITRNLNTITITANSEGVVFSDPYAYKDVNGIGIVDADIIWEITNVTPDIFTIDDINFNDATTNQCQNVKLNITTNVLATKIISPFVLNGNTQNPFSFDWIRGQSINLILENSLGTQTSQSIVLPSLLNASNFTPQITNSPSGATVVIIGVNNDGLVLEYSLDNSTWQTSNTFSGLAAGDFTLYVRDQLGCSFSKPFTVTNFDTDPNPSSGLKIPYFYISKSNSFRFANRITFGDSDNYKNDENTLSCEVDVELAYNEIQQFQSADIITTQFKSNYETNVATIVKSDLSEVNVPVVKMTNNINIKDKRDAIKYNAGSGKTGVYFLSGNTYDYDTNAINGTYSLNGSLPEWAVIGNYVQLGSSWFLIEEIVFDEAKNADVIVFTNSYTGIDAIAVVGTIFNRFNYEVYEFTIDMVDYIDQYFNVRINSNDQKFTELIHFSELIWCKIKHEDVLEIRYRNTTNTDVFYATGIENKIRVPYSFIKGKIDEENETHKTDTNSVLLNSDIYEVDEIVFEPVTKELWRKLTQALSHEKVSINGVGYVKNGNFNTEGPLEKSNLYVLTATMIKTGNVYNSQTSGNLDFDGSAVEVPGLISTESGYVSY